MNEGEVTVKSFSSRIRRAYLLSTLSANTSAGVAFALLAAAAVLVPGIQAMVANYGYGPLPMTGALALGALIALTQAALYGSLVVARMVRADRTGTVSY